MITVLSNANATGASVDVHGWGTSRHVLTAVLYGNFGTGTLDLQLTPDGGVTWVTMKDTAGNPITATSNEAFDVNISSDLAVRGAETVAGLTSVSLVLL